MSVEKIDNEYRLFCDKCEREAETTDGWKTECVMKGDVVTEVDLCPDCQEIE